MDKNFFIKILKFKIYNVSSKSILKYYKFPIEIFLNLCNNIQYIVMWVFKCTIYSDI